MTKWNIFMLCMQTVTIATTAVNFWCYYRLPVLKKTIKLQRQAYEHLRIGYDGLVEQHRQSIEDAAKLNQLLNGRR